MQKKRWSHTISVKNRIESKKRVKKKNYFCFTKLSRKGKWVKKVNQNNIKTELMCKYLKKQKTRKRNKKTQTSRQWILFKYLDWK